MAIRRLICAAVTLFSLNIAGALAAQEANNHPNQPGRVQEKHVLILHSYHPGFPWTDQIMAAMQDVFSAHGRGINTHVEYLDTKRHTDIEYVTHILDAIMRYKLSARSFDLILLSDNEALEFVLDHRRDLFPDTPVVFSGINDYTPQMLRGDINITGVIEPNVYGDILNLALKFFPETREVVVISSNREHCSLINHDEFLQAAVPLEERVAFDYWMDLPADLLEKRLAALPADRIVFINAPVSDGSGHVLSFEEKARLIREASPVPIFSAWDTYLELGGIIGGPLLSARRQGEVAARMALDILQGAAIAEMQVITPQVCPPIFDYAMLQRHKVPLKTLPSSHLLINEPPSFYRLSKQQALIAGGVFSGSLGVILLLSSNILSRRKAERLLRDSELNYRQLSQQFQIILDGIPDGLTLISRDMRVIWSNKGAGNYFNKILGSVPGEYCCKMLYNRKTVCENCPAVDAFRTGHYEESIITTPDKRILEVKAFPLKEGGGTVSHVIMLASDITEKHRLRQEAIHSSRLASLGELAAGVAHEINNPNALILLNTELLRKVCCDTAPILQRHLQEHGDFLVSGLPYSEMMQELPHLFAEMQDGANRIRRIVEDLKDFTRAEGTDLDELVDINEAARASIRLIGNSIKKATIHFTADYGEDLPHLRGSLQRIEQVIINLLMNACQALTDRQQGVSLRTWFDEASGRIHLEVRDEGCGIPLENLDHLTDPFFTTKREHGGTGLGLSVSSRIVKDHQGTLTFSSTPNQGTTVVLTLPACLEVIRNESDEGRTLPRLAYSAG